MIMTGVTTVLSVGWVAYGRFPFQLVPVTYVESIKLRLLMQEKSMSSSEFPPEAS